MMKRSTTEKWQDASDPIEDGAFLGTIIRERAIGTIESVRALDAGQHSLLVKPSLRVLSSVDAARRHLKLLGRLVPTPPRGIKTIVVEAGGVRTERITAPASRHDRYILYLHGGSYLAGPASTAT